MIMHFKSLAQTKLSVFVYINATRKCLVHTDVGVVDLHFNQDLIPSITVTIKAANPMIRHYQKQEKLLAIPGICDREGTRNV